MKTKRTILLILVLSVSILCTVFVYAKPVRKKEKNYVPGEILIKYKADVFESDKEGVRNRVLGKRMKHLGRINVERMKLKGSLDVEQAVDILSRDPRVEYVKPNLKVVYLGMSRTVPTENSSIYNLQWHLDDSTGSSVTVNSVAYTVDVDIDAPEAWAVLGSAYSNTLSTSVSVIDSGCGDSGFFSNSVGYIPNHQDLLNSLLFVNSAEAINATDDPGDGNTLIDDVNGWDWYTTPDDIIPGEDNDPADVNTTADDWHGTFISGIISGAWDNSLGGAGVGKNLIKLLPLRTPLTVADLIDAIGYTAALADSGEDVKVINASWAITPQGADDSDLRLAVSDAGDSGILFVAAAGNFQLSFPQLDNDILPLYPASYSTSLNNVLAVAATDLTGDLSSGTHYGLNSVQIAAPGVSIVTTYFGTSDYAFVGGTSFSTPIVATGGALIAAAHPNFLPSQIIERITNGGDFDQRFETKIGSGKRFNLAGALAPFYPYSGEVALGSTTSIQLYTDSVSSSFGSISGWSSSDSSVAVLSGSQATGWAVSPVGTGIATFTLSFSSGSAPLGSYETGHWWVVAAPSTGGGGGGGWGCGTLTLPSDSSNLPGAVEFVLLALLLVSGRRVYVRRMAKISEA